MANNSDDGIVRIFAIANDCAGTTSVSTMMHERTIRSYIIKDIKQVPKTGILFLGLTPERERILQERAEQGLDATLGWYGNICLDSSKIIEFGLVPEDTQAVALVLVRHCNWAKLPHEVLCCIRMFIRNDPATGVLPWGGLPTTESKHTWLKRWTQARPNWSTELLERHKTARRERKSSQSSRTRLSVSEYIPAGASLVRS